MPKPILPKRAPQQRSALGSTFSWLRPFFFTSVGAKQLTAVTGTLLIGFVIGHLAGNLQIFAGLGGAQAGQEWLNSYAKHLKETGPLLWVARAGLLTLFLLHLFLTLRLAWQNGAARPIPYAYEDTVRATLISRWMVTTGLIIGTFLIFHLAHYTIGSVKGATVEVKSLVYSVNYLDLRDAAGRHDVYTMSISGFRNPWIVLIYIIGQIALLMHLAHGAASVFQTFGAAGRGVYPVVACFGWLLASAIALGNIAMPLAVYFGYLPVGEVYFMRGGEMIGPGQLITK